MNLFTAKETIANYMNEADKRMHSKKRSIIILAILGGVFIGFGAVGSSLAVHNMTSVGTSRTLAGMVFPVGLMMVLLTGAKLFTGDCLMIMNVAMKRNTVWQMLRVLVLVYLGNMIGGVLLALMVDFSGQFDYSSGLLGAYTIKVAAGKVTMPFYKALLSGVLCNILVCTSVFMTGCVKDVVSKLFCVFFPIMLFVVCGFEHCVANMYYVPAGIFAAENPEYVLSAINDLGVNGADIDKLSWLYFMIKNQLPVTLGNVIGGMVCFALPLWFSHKEDER